MAEPEPRATAGRGRATHPDRLSQLSGLRPLSALAVPLAFTLLLVTLGWLPSIRQNPTLRWSFHGTGAVLLLWCGALLAVAVARGRSFSLRLVLRKQHWVQACAQLIVYVYWGWYWRVVYDSAALIVGQLVFAYAFHALLEWSRRETHVLSFGSFPIILSINLFLWFKPDWFYLQFVMVAMGFMAKELIRWEKEGRQAHVFNPSSFPLSVFSLVLILTGTTDLTWGVEIATTLLHPPHIYLVIFLVALPAQLLFGVTSMTLSAVTTAYTLNLAFYGVTGGYWFADPRVPIGVFVGMNLLFVDPSTSPRTEAGRVMFGTLYGLSVLALFALLGRFDIPTFYDKLLPIPILNTAIQGIDRLARSDVLRRFNPAALAQGTLRAFRRNVAYVSVWAVVFVLMQVQIGPQMVLARADARLSQDDFGEAITEYQEFLELEPDHAGAHRRLARALVAASQAQQAFPSLERALQLQPDSPEAHNTLGLALMQIGRAPDAIAPLEHVLRIAPEHPEASYNLGLALLRSGRPQDALAPLERALELRPDHPDAFNNLGLALIQTGRAADAIRPLRQAIELEPAHPEAHNSLGLALLLAGRPDEAVSSLGQALRLEPRYPEEHYNLALALAATGRADAAAEQFEVALRLRPDWAEALRDYALLRSTHPDSSVRDPEAAVRLASRAAEITNDGDPSMLDALAAAYASAGRFAEAVATAEEAAALAERSGPELEAEIRANLALYRSGRPLVRSGG